MIEILLASMLFATIPQLEAPAPTVYAEPVAVVETVEDVTVPVDDYIETIDESIEPVDESEHEPAEACTHGVYESIEDLGGGYFVGICECGEAINWYESNGEDIEEGEEIPIEEDEEEESYGD